MLAVHLGLLLIGAFAILLFGPDALGHAKPGEAPDPIRGVAIIVGVWSWLLYSAVAVVVNRVRLTPEQVERRTVLGERVLRRVAVVGVRGQGEDTILLCTDAKRHDGLGVPRAVIKHPVWAAWLQTLPDLGRQDFVDEQVRKETDPALGRNPSERRARMVVLNRISALVFLGVLALSAWGFFWPRPYLPAILVNAATPLVALLVLWRGGRQAGLVDGLAGAVLLPVMVLSLRAMFDLDVLDPWPLRLCAGLVALAAAAAGTVWSQAERPWARLLVGAIAGGFTFCWTWSVLGFVDVLPDKSKPWIVRTIVVARDDEGKHRSELTLRALDPSRETFSSIYVSKRRAEGVRLGDTACLAVHRGRLGWRWGYVTDC